MQFKVEGYSYLSHPGEGWTTNVVCLHTHIYIYINMKMYIPSYFTCYRLLMGGGSTQDTGASSRLSIPSSSIQ